MRCLIRTVPWDEERYRWAEELADQLPNASLVVDRDHNGYATFLDAIAEQGDEDCWHFEDDVELVTDWEAKARSHEWYDGVINGFGNLGVRRGGWCRAWPFFYSLCFRIPGDMAPSLLEHASDPENIERVEKYWPQPFDLIIGDWLEAEGRHYWQAYPSLVQHRAVPSLMGHDRFYRADPDFVR
jgi:hypothetical protein